MAPTEGLSAPGSASYDSNTMTVGDGTWDFTKNTFLLPNLVGLNFETMQYNGMGNRFSTLTQYHSLVTGHGVLAAITFLFLVPIAIMYARFHPDRRRGRRIHAYLQILSVGLATVVFILGFFAVGPSRSLTNPHHGIGVALYVLILTQAIGGSMVRKIFKKSLRLMIHRWFGGVVGILGVVQIPLGLTLYGSPKFTFILYALWMGFLVFLYFILSWRHENDWDDNTTMYGGRSYGGRSESGVTQSEHKSKRGFGWLGPLVAALGAWALFRGRKRGSDGSQSRSESPSQSGRTPEVIPSRRASTSYYMGNEKYSERTDRQEGGLLSKVLAVGGLVGAGALFKKFKGRKDDRRYDEEYSAVATDTPNRFGGPRTRPLRKRHDDYTESEFTEDRTELGARPRTPLLPSAAGPRPSTPRASHARTATSALDSQLYSDYSSYVSPSRRQREDEHHSGAGKGILAGLGLGWFAKMLKDRRDRRAEEERLRLEEERRDGRHGSRYTGDGYSTPTRPSRRRPPVGAPTTTIMSEDTESSYIEARPLGTSIGGPPMPPLAAGNAPPGAAPIPRPRSRSRSPSRHDVEQVSMPPMPPDPQGVLASLHQASGSESYMSRGGRPNRRDSSRRRRDGEQAAAAAASSAAGLAAEEERHRDRSRASQPLSVVKVKYHDDRDRNVTLRRLTEEEARREQRRGRSASVSSLSGSETPGQRRYRRDGSARKTADEAEAERLVSGPLSPPTPAFAGGGRGGKDSAYYSGQPGPSAGSPPVGAPTVSSIASHGTWSALSPTPSGPITNPRPPGSVAASAAERRQRRRLERNRDARPGTGTIDYT
ncbi:hypothetical protein ANO14919_135380 [Xylariales sp. No.14919]|nr:hypothetical protein F5X98DRAFT_355132 [Xylaria grammica]GAW23960.1 hypothetical protein ANO14919_135380 [Xylariales sp. No.14919]